MFASFNARALGHILGAWTTLQVAANAGFAGVDLLVRDLLRSGDDPGELRLRMDDLGLRGGGWPLPVNWRGPRGEFEADLADLERHAEAAAKLGLVTTGTWVLPEAPPRGMPDGGPPAERSALFDWHVDRLGAIARILDAHGQKLALEVLGPATLRSGHGVPFVHRLDQLTPLLNAIRGRQANVGLLADAFHLHAAGETCEALSLFGPGSIAWAHVADLAADAPADLACLNDLERALPGSTGRVDVTGFLSHLAGDDYDGPVTVETLRATEATGPEVSALAAARALRLHWPRGPSPS